MKPKGSVRERNYPRRRAIRPRANLLRRHAIYGVYNKRPAKNCHPADVVCFCWSPSNVNVGAQVLLTQPTSGHYAL